MFLTVVKIQNILTITMVLVILGWTTIARVMRGAVLSAKNLDYVLAARSLGAGTGIVMQHIPPNAVCPRDACSPIPRQLRPPRRR